MKRNLGKYSALMLLTLTITSLSGNASADCRLDDGTSKVGTNGPAELLPPCSEQAGLTLDNPASRANKTNPDPLVQKVKIVPSQDKFRNERQ
jgi:hypothetical protein